MSRARWSAEARRLHSVVGQRFSRIPRGHGVSEVPQQTQRMPDLTLQTPECLALRCFVVESFDVSHDHATVLVAETEVRLLGLLLLATSFERLDPDQGSSSRAIVCPTSSGYMQVHSIRWPKSCVWPSQSPQLRLQRRQPAPERQAADHRICSRRFSSTSESPQDSHLSTEPPQETTEAWRARQLPTGAGGL